jgi:hypothetical protein
VSGDDRRAALLPEGKPNFGTGFSDVAAIPVWDGASGRETRAPAGCAAFHPALAGNRVAWSCADQHESYLQVGDARGRRGTTIHTTGPAWTCLGGDAAGNGSLLVADGENIVCRIDGRSARMIFRDRLPLTVLSVRQRRILVRRGRSQLLVLDATGRLIRSVSSGDPSLTAAAFSASRLVTAGRTLRVFDLRSGRQLHSWPIGPPGLPPRVAGVSGHITAYVSGDAIHLLNLDTGQDSVLEFPAQGGPAAASLTTAGLFYSYRRLHDPRPGIVGFVPARRLDALGR